MDYRSDGGEWDFDFFFFFFPATDRRGAIDDYEYDIYTKQY